MKVVIYISDYEDSVDVFVDWEKLKIKNLSPFSKAEFECDCEKGIHEITAVRHPKICDRNWKRGVFFDWLSGICGIPSANLAEMKRDEKQYSITLKVNIEQDEYIGLILTENGFVMTEAVNEVLDIVKQAEVSKTARRRTIGAYVIPSIILAAVIEIFFIVFWILFIINRIYFRSFILLALAVFWALLVSKFLLRSYKRK